MGCRFHPCSSWPLRLSAAGRRGHTQCHNICMALAALEEHGRRASIRGLPMRKVALQPWVIARVHRRNHQGGRLI